MSGASSTNLARSRDAGGALGSIESAEHGILPRDSKDDGAGVRQVESVAKNV